MEDLLISVAVGDIAGMPYEFGNRTKNYNDVRLLNAKSTYTDDTVCTFACAESLLNHTDMATTLWSRCRMEKGRGYGGRFRKWLNHPHVTPAYNSFGNGSAMRVAAAGFMATTSSECIDLAISTAMPTHNHPEGIKGAVATALAIFYGMQSKGKTFIREKVLDVYYPQWSGCLYKDIQPDYRFDETCQITVPAALICFLESNDYTSCIKLAIALGGDADTLAAIAGPIAYAHYKYMPEELLKDAKNKLPKWMLDVSYAFDEHVNNTLLNASLKTGIKPTNEQTRVYNGIRRPLFTPEKITSLNLDEVFVFGSNSEGMHWGGAARTAHRHFGAIMGVSVGIQGQSYAIPTMEGGLESIRHFVNDFIQFARHNKHLFFFVTRIGCGIAGYTDNEIAPLFVAARNEENICLPKTFVS